MRVRGDAPAPADAAGRVELKLAQDATEHWTDVLDHKRSPIVRWARCHWHSSGALCPGLLQAQARKTSEQPADLLRLHRRVATWMKKHAVRMNPFDHAPEQLTMDPPANLNMFWAWAFPAAEAWVAMAGPSGRGTPEPLVLLPQRDSGRRVRRSVVVLSRFVRGGRVGLADRGACLPADAAFRSGEVARAR